MTATATIRDRYGLAISTTSTAAAEHYVEGVDLLLEQGYGTEQCFQQAIEADEGFALAYAGLSMMQMLRGAAADAKASVAKAQQLVRSATRREQQHVEGVALFTNGQGPKSLAVILEHLDEFPRDAVMMRVANRLYLLGCSGAGVQNFPEELYAMLQKLEPSYGDDWAFLGQYAFAHHETGRLDEALSLAERSLAARPTSGHASHSVAHVYFEKGNAVDGGDFLGNWLKGYDSRAPFKIHLSWHQALFELAQGKYSDAVKLYEDVIRPTVVEKSANSLMDSTSLMWRLRMYGNCNPPYPIEEISEQASPAATTPGPAFRDAHAALAFAASGDEERLNSVKARLRDLAGQGDALAKEVTLPLVKGIGAFADDRYEDAARYSGTRIPAARPSRRKPRPARSLRGHPTGVIHPRRAIRQSRRPAPRAPQPPLLRARQLLASSHQDQHRRHPNRPEHPQTSRPKLAVRRPHLPRNRHPQNPSQRKLVNPQN